MTTESASQIQSFSLSIQGLTIGILLAFLAVLSLDVFGIHLGFSFLPVAAIYLWPRAASYSWSLLGVFLLGVFYDIVSVSPIGMWTLAFLILFLVMGGGIRHRDGFAPAFFRFCLSVLLVLLIVFLVGRFSLGQWPHLSALFVNAIGSIIIFPIIYWIRSLFTALRDPGEHLGKYK